MSIVELLSGPVGGLAYHLTTLFTAQAVLGMALGEWLRERKPEHRRLVFSFGLLCLTRLFSILVALVTWQGFVPPQSVLPPLARFLDTVTLLVIVYALALRQDRAARINRRFCLISLALAFVVYCVFAPLWYITLIRYPSLHYSGSWQEWIWIVWQVIVLVWALSLTGLYKARQGGLFISIFFILLIGDVMQLAAPQVAPHAALWGRLAYLLAYPIFVVAIYRSIVDELTSRTTVPVRETVSEEAVYPKDARDAPDIEAALSIFSSLDLPTVLERATKSAMDILEVDLVAVLTRTVESSYSTEIAAARHSVGLYEMDKGEIDVRRLPTLERVLEREEEVVLGVETDEPADRLDLLEQMGAAQELGLVLEPLVAGGSSIGVLVIGDSSPQRLSYARNSHLSQILAKSIASAVHNALLHREAASNRDDQGEEPPEPGVVDTSEVVEVDLGRGVEPSTYPSERVRLELLYAQRELDEAKREIQAQRAACEEEARKGQHQERIETEPEPMEPRGDLLDQGDGRLDIELVERLEAELKQAHQDLAQARAALEDQPTSSDPEPAGRSETDNDQVRHDSPEDSKDDEDKADAPDEGS